MTSAGVARRMPRSGIVGSWFGADRPPTETALAFPVCFTHLRNTGVRSVAVHVKAPGVYRIRPSAQYLLQK